MSLCEIHRFALLRALHFLDFFSEINKITKVLSLNNLQSEATAQPFPAAHMAGDTHRWPRVDALVSGIQHKHIIYVPFATTGGVS